MDSTSRDPIKIEGRWQLVSQMEVLGVASKAAAAACSPDPSSHRGSCRWRFARPCQSLWPALGRPSPQCPAAHYVMVANTARCCAAHHDSTFLRTCHVRGWMLREWSENCTHREHDAGLVLVHRLVGVHSRCVFFHTARLTRQDGLVAPASSTLANYR